MKSYQIALNVWRSAGWISDSARRRASGSLIVCYVPQWRDTAVASAYVHALVLGGRVHKIDWYAWALSALWKASFSNRISTTQKQRWLFCLFGRPNYVSSWPVLPPLGLNSFRCRLDAAVYLPTIEMYRIQRNYPFIYLSHFRRSTTYGITNSIHFLWRLGFTSQCG